MHDDIYVHILYFAYKNNGLFKASQFRYIADPPETWYMKNMLLNYMTDRGWFRKFRPENSRVFIYQITELGRIYLEEHL